MVEKKKRFLEESKEGEEDNKLAAPGLDPTITANLVAVITCAFSKAINAAVTSTTTAINAQPLPIITKHTSVINPYNTQSFGVVTKEGRYQWAQATKIQDRGGPIWVTVSNVKKIINMVKD